MSVTSAITVHGVLLVRAVDPLSLHGSVGDTVSQGRHGGVIHCNGQAVPGRVET